MIEGDDALYVGHMLDAARQAIVLAEGKSRPLFSNPSENEAR